MASFTTPNPYVMALRNLEREREIPEAMAQEAMMPAQGQMVSGHYVAPSWTQGLSKLAQAYMAKKGMGRIDQEMQDTVSSRNKALSDALRGPQIPEMIRNPDYVEPPLSERIGAVDPDLGLQMALREREREQKFGDAKELIDYRRSIGGDKPASVAEWEYYSQLPPDQQDAYLLMKRSNPYLNLGGTMEQPSPTRPGVALGGFEKTVPPEQQPGFKAAQTTAVESARAGVKPTAAQTAVDTQFGKDYAEFMAGGGAADMQKNIDQIQTVVDRLSSGSDNLTGPILGTIPQGIRARTMPESVDTQQLVEEAVQRNLRLILGAQFTEKEGERLISRAYNPALEEGTNESRLSRLLKAMKEAAKAKESAARYYEENGTLVGWKGTMPSVSSIESAIDTKEDTPSKNAQESGGIKFLGFE